MILVECKLSQNRKILSILMIIFLFVVVVANSSTKPINYGNKVHLLCSYEKPISGCRFILPGETSDILLENTNVRYKKYEYFGNGFETGDCGITIYNATKENEGYARCILKDYDNSEQSETVKVKIFDYSNMELPKMKILNSGPLLVNQTLEVECVTKSTDQYSDIIWLLNDRILHTFTTKAQEHHKDGIFELKSILKHQLDTLDNGRTLKCRSRVSNHTQEFVDTTLELVVLNETRLIEPRIGMPFDISITFYANPRVRSSKWKVNETVIYYRKSLNEFVSKELKNLGNQRWEAILHIKNITDINIHYNYTLQVDGVEGTNEYFIRLDNSINEADQIINEPIAQEEEEKEEETTLFQSIGIGENSITSSPKLYSTKHPQKGGKLSTFRRTTTRYSTYKNNNVTIHPYNTTERKAKSTRKQQKNTSVSIAEMTSVTSTHTITTTEMNTVIITKAHINESTTEAAVVIDENSLKNEYYEENTTFNRANDVKEFDMTTSRNLIDIITINDDSNDIRRNDETSTERLFIKICFITMVLIIAIFLFMLCHYRHQVAILKTEIIQMNLENYYNQSCLYPSTFNEYSSTNFQQIDGVSFYIKRPLNISSNNSSSVDSDTSSNQFLSTYNTNSHLYQSIDADDIENHVYDEIIQTKENDDEKPNNYENNESFNNITEMLIPSHCHTLMTIHEEEEDFEASHIQILSSLESTYI